MDAQSTMTREVFTVDPHHLLGFVWSLMSKHHVRHIPVVENGKLVGILSDRDILVRSSMDGGLLFVPTMRVENAMTRNLVTCRKDASIGAVCDAMLANTIDCVPIVENDNLVGLITSTDLIRLLRGNEEIWMTKPLPFTFKVTREDFEEVPQVALGIPG
ncbi:MAG TPA: CBS domain-containing protein [bacterium]|nr:CBS domain-containing protein [bacterium]